MPLKEKVAYSKVVKLPNGLTTLALFNKSHQFIEYRACILNKKTGKYVCPRQSSNPKERAIIRKKLGI